MDKVAAMKMLAACVACLLTVSCNTTIGIGRDLKEGYHWTKGKIQNSQGGSQDPYGAPIY